MLWRSVRYSHVVHGAMLKNGWSRTTADDPLMEHHSPCWKHVKLMPWTEAWGEGGGRSSKQPGGAASGTFCFCLFFPLHQFIVLCCFISLSSSSLLLRHCTRHALVCSGASISVHCYPINVSIFVPLYMECKPVKPLARPRACRHFSSAGSKRLQWLCVLRQFLHIHRVSRRARVRVCSLQVKLAQVVLDKRVVRGGVPLIFFIPPARGGWTDVLKLIMKLFQVFVLHSFLCEWTSLFLLCDCQSLLSFLYCPTMYSDLILYCAKLSYLVLCSFVLLFLACLALSWSIVSFLIRPITSYPILSYLVLPHFTSYIPIHPTTHCLSYPDVFSRRDLWSLSVLSWPTLSNCQTLQTDWTELNAAWPTLTVNSPHL